MENKRIVLYEALKKAADDQNETVFNEVLKQQNEYIESIEVPEEKKETILYFLEKNQEITTLFQKQKEGIQQLLLAQHHQIQAVKKYDEF